MAATKTLNTNGSPINFISWNVKGLNHPVKRKRVMSHLQKLNVGIAFLQESHLRPSDHFRMRRGWVGQLFHSTFTAKARGAAILIHKSIPLIVSEVMADPRGRFVVVKGKLFDTPLILANVYAPNFDDSQFFKNFLSSLPDMHSHHLILGGDFNCTLNPSLDRSSTRRTPPQNQFK